MLAEIFDYVDDTNSSIVIAILLVDLIVCCSIVWTDRYVNVFFIFLAIDFVKMLVIVLFVVVGE